MPDIVEDTDIQGSTDTLDIDPIADSDSTSITAADVAAVEPAPQEQETVIEDTVEVDEQITESEPDADVPVVDWEKRYNDQQSYVGQQGSEIHRLRQDAERYAQLGDPQQAMQQIRQFKEQSAKQDLKAWNSRSPEYSNFQSVRSKADAYNQLISNATPETRDAIIQSAAGQFSTEEQAMLGAYNEHNAHTQRQLAEDPEGFINNIVNDLVQSRFQEYEQYQGQRGETDQYMSENKDLIDRNGDDFMRIISGQGSNRELALEYVQMKEEIASMKTQLGQSLESQVHADAQSAATKRTATVSRDLSNSAPKQDPVALAKEKGLSGMARLRFIENYNNKG